MVMKYDINTINQFRFMFLNILLEVIIYYPAVYNVISQGGVR